MLNYTIAATPTPQKAQISDTEAYVLMGLFGIIMIAVFFSAIRFGNMFRK